MSGMYKALKIIIIIIILSMDLQAYSERMTSHRILNWIFIGNRHHAIFRTASVNSTTQLKTNGTGFFKISPFMQIDLLDMVGHIQLDECNRNVSSPWQSSIARSPVSSGQGCARTNCDP